MRIGRHAMNRFRVAVLIMVLGAPWTAGADEGAGTEFVRGWLRAIRANSKEAVSGATSLPFTYREAWPKKRCERSSKDQKGLADWLTCVRKKEKLLIGELKWEKENLRLAAGNAQASDKLRALAKDFGSTGEWVNGAVNGDGVTYEFLFLLQTVDGKPRVSAVLIDVSFDQG
jgi:hypothetical protein